MEAPNSQRADIAAVRLAKATSQLAALWRGSSTCLRNLDDATWMPTSIAVGNLEPQSRTSWQDVPLEAGFRVNNPSVNGKKRKATLLEQSGQCAVYDHFRCWVEQTCGVREDELKSILRTSQALQKSSRGVSDLPLALKKDWGGKQLTIMAHALLLCRVRGLHNALQAVSFAELGGEGGHARAQAELTRLMEMGPKKLKQHHARVSQPMRQKYGLNLPRACETLADRASTVHSLMLLWIFGHGAEIMGAADPWQQLLDAPSHIPVKTLPQQIAFDGVVFDLHELLTVTYSGAVASKFAHSSSKVREGSLPLARVWWQLSWDCCCKEVLARYGTECRCCCESILGSAITISACDIHLMLFQDPGTGERLWRNLEQFERSRGRAVDYNQMG